ncbi:ras-related and estrogen-regulated growth inhibitor-like [Ylistrum balloti]|uniref:ras-related and estrogen-regulated growth inhibitor-like n=1 Tax=Ylistrum balloti TaxID=509963 RepID=UPI002905B50D|nr:ras-related and estrogen-regulated growth inhibitor-like [Ylistrum balloti]
MHDRGIKDKIMNGSRYRSNGSDSKDTIFKVVLLGCPGVGKTALTVRFLTKRFIGEYCPTLESIYKYRTNFDDDEVKMEILDTAGQMEEGWKDGYALWGDCFVFVYSITDKDSFDEIINIKRQVENVRHSTAISGILVGNKSDLLHDRQVPVNHGMELADEIGCKFYEVSAADWTQVSVITEMFQDLFRECRRAKSAREGRQRKASSSLRFKQAIQKVISGKAPARRTLSA